MKIFKKISSTVVATLLTLSLFQGQFVVKAVSPTPSFSNGFVGLSNNPAVAGKPQQFFLTAGNLDGEVQYQVFYIKASLNSSERNDPKNWTKVQDWTTSQSALVPYVYNVPALSAGDYSFAVRIRRAGFTDDMTLYKNSVGGYDDVYAFNYSFKSSSNLDVTGIKTDKSDYSLGDTISITGLDGNTKYKLYTFSQSTSGTNWSKDPVASGSTLTWTPKASGNYVLDVQAFDSKNNIIGWKLINVEVGGVSTNQSTPNTNTTPTPSQTQVNNTPTITSVSNVVASTNTGTAPNLPSTITATLSDGTTKNVNVTWDTVDPSKYSVSGTFTINGTIAGASSIKAIASVTVTGTPVIAATSLTMDSAVVTSINSIKVTFNRSVSDTSKAVFTVTSGNAAISLNTPIWNDTRTEATLIAPAYAFTSGGYVLGNYLVTVSGLDNLDATKSSQTITSTGSSSQYNQYTQYGTSKVTSISFTSTQLVRSADGYSATFNYSVKDQYGADITNRCTSLQTTTSFGSAASVYLNPATSTGTINYNFNANYSTTSVVVSIYDPSTNVSNAATLGIGGLTSTVSSFAFGDIVYATNNSRLASGMSSAATIPVTAKDQYGNTITDLNTLNNSFYMYSSNSSVANFNFTIDSYGRPAININTATGNTSASQTVTLTVVSKLGSGSTYTKMLDIGGTYSQIRTIVFGDSTSTIVSVGDSNIVLPVTVTNQYGAQLSLAEIVANASSINSMISSTGCISQPQVITDVTDINYGKLKFNALYAGTATISAYTTSGSTIAKQIIVRDAKILTSINVPSTINVAQGSTAYITPAFLDQYGSTITTLNSTNTNNMRYSLYLTKVSGSDNCVTITPVTSGTIPGNLSSIAVIGGSSAGVASGTGSYRLTINITDSNGTIRNQSSVLITVQ